MKALTEKLTKEFADGDYAHAYMESHIVSRLASQIYTLRKQRGWSQEELAKKAGITQAKVSKIESADFDSLTMKSLQGFSKAFDVNLLISFTSFSDAILDVVTLNSSKLKIAEREDDLARFKKSNISINFEGNVYTPTTSHLSLVKTLPVKASNLITKNNNEFELQYK